jgi:hypothetical protein
MRYDRSSADCQSADWKRHKRECKMNELLNQMNEEHARRPPPKPDCTRSTGCHGEFNEEEGMHAEDECPDCGYLACESCVCHHSRGTFDRFG